MPEFYKDLQIDSDADIELTAGKDLKTTDTQDQNISQSLGITARKELKELISRPMVPKTFEAIRSVIRESVGDDPQIDSILEVEIVEINRATDSVSARIVVDEDEDFEITVTA